MSLKQGTVWNLTGNSSITTPPTKRVDEPICRAAAGMTKTLTATNYTGTNGFILLEHLISGLRSLPSGPLGRRGFGGRRHAATHSPTPEALDN